MSGPVAPARSARHVATIAAVSAAVVVIYLVRLLAMGHTEVVRSDYLSTQTAGVIVASGDGADLYADSAQGAAYARLAAGDHSGILLFNHAPLAAAMDAPVSGLDPVAGHLVWSLVQFLMVVAGCAIAALAAPWPARSPRLLPLASVAVALAGAGTLPMLTEGQDLGTVTLGLGIAYAAWQTGRLAAGAAALVAGAAVAKPHLALGLLAFMAGWRDRRVLLGGLAAGAIAVVLSLAVVGWAGDTAFVGTLLRSNGLWPQAQYIGFTGLTATWLGEGLAANLVALAAGVAALVTAAALGVAVRRDRSRLGVALAGATLLSLLASPHTLSHDLTLLAPMLVVVLAEAARRARQAGWPDRSTRRVLIAWAVLFAATGADTALTLPAALGRLTTLTLMIASGFAVSVALRPELVRRAAATTTTGGSLQPT